MKLIFLMLLISNMAYLIFHLVGSDQHKLDAVVQSSSNHQEKKLQTVAERDVKLKTSIKTAPKTMPEIISSPSFKAGEGRCQLVGPFIELLHAEYLVERLAGLEVVASVKNIEVIDGKTYWVYLKPETSEKEALRRLYEVQAKAIDGYIIPKGELANGISFGQFGDQAGAESKAEQVRGQGYVVNIKEISRGHGELWVEINQDQGQKINEDQWVSLLKEEKDIERRNNYCLGVANP